VRAGLDNIKDFLNKAANLNHKASKILEYYANEIKNLDGKSVAESSEKIKTMVLAGLRPNGTYSGNSYSLFVREFVGLTLSDPKLYIAKLKAREDLDVPLKVEETDFIDFVKSTKEITEFILNKAKSLNISFESPKEHYNEESKNKEIEDLIVDFVNDVYNLAVGVNEFTSFVYSLRKITPEYAKRAYHEISDDVLNLLGVSTLIQTKSLEIIGFPDYLTDIYSNIFFADDYYIKYTLANGIQIKPKIEAIEKLLKDYQNSLKLRTLGGAICSLNGTIWGYLTLLRDHLAKWFDGFTSIQDFYIKRAWESLTEVEWDIPEYLTSVGYDKLYCDFESFYKAIFQGSIINHALIYEDGIIKKYYKPRDYITADKDVFSEYSLSNYIPLIELFSDLMPAIFVGICDVTLRFNHKSGCIVLLWEV